MDDFVAEFTEILQKLTKTGGTRERTSIYPNAEVIDDSPSALPSNYIIVSSDQGYYIPAVKIPGIKYTTGDNVNLIIIEGTEPIAFQQGSESSGTPFDIALGDLTDVTTVGQQDNYFLKYSNDAQYWFPDYLVLGDLFDVTTIGAENNYFLQYNSTAQYWFPNASTTTGGGGGAWPADGTAKIDETEYASLAAAYTAATAGDVIKLGPGIFTLSATLDIIKNITIIGTGRKETIIRYGADHVIQVGDVSNSPTVNLYNLTIDYSGTSASFYPLYLFDGTLYCENIDVIGDDFNSSLTCRTYRQDDGDAVLLNCNFTLANAGSATDDRALSFGSSSTGTCKVIGGVIDGEDFDIAGFNTIVRVYGAELVNGTYQNTTDFNGWYYFNGRAYQLVSGTIYTPIGAKTSDNDIYRGDNVSSSRFISTISGTPSGSTLVYGTVTTGNENVIVPNSTSQLAKMVLHNTTRGDNLLILSVNTGTNTITFTSAVPGTWASGDTITTDSQTATGDVLGTRYIDFEFTSGLNDGASSFQMSMSYTNTGAPTAGIILGLHPFTAQASSKRFQVGSLVSGLATTATSPLFPLIENRFCMCWNATGTGTAILVTRLFAEG